MSTAFPMDMHTGQSGSQREIKTDVHMRRPTVANSSGIFFLRVNLRRCRQLRHFTIEQQERRTVHGY
jgi:hypothetical protein